MSARLVLGLGGTVDYEIRWDAAVISTLARHYGVRRAELVSAAPIEDERALIVAILGLLERGVGGSGSPPPPTCSTPSRRVSTRR
jgi:ADP-dependent phosphofructokinase/glucokinase